MAYQGLTAHIPAGLIGLNADENRLQQPVGSLVAAEGVIFEDGLLAKDTGARRMTALVSDTQVPFTFQATDPPVYGAVLAALPQATIAGPAPTLVGSVLSDYGLPGGTLLLYTETAVQKDDVIVLTVGMRTYLSQASVGVLQFGDPEEPVQQRLLATNYVPAPGTPWGGVLAFGQFVILLLAPRNMPAGTPLRVRFEQATLNPPVPAPILRIQARAFRNLVPNLSAAKVAGASGAPTMTLNATIGASPQLLLAFGLGFGPLAGQSLTLPASFSAPIENGGVGPTNDPYRDCISYLSWGLAMEPPAKRIVGLHDWWGTPSEHHIFVADETGRVTISGNIPASGSFPADERQVGHAVSALTTAKFVQGGNEALGLPRKLFFFADGAVPGVFPEGPTDAPVFHGANHPTYWPDAPDDWGTGHTPVNGAIVANRLAVIGNQNFPHAIYFSTPSNHKDFRTGQGAVVLQANSQVGERLWGAVAFQGLLVLFKYPRGIFLVSTADTDPANWRVETKSEGLGCAPSPHAALALDDDILFLAADGTFHMLSAVDTPFGLQASDIGSLLNINKWVRETVNLQALNRVTSVWYGHKRTAYFALPMKGSLSNQLILRFDFNARDRDGEGVGIKVSYSFRDTGDALALYRPTQTNYERPFLGDGGVIYELDDATKLKDGASYPMYYRTPPLDMASVAPELRKTRKNWQFVEFILEPAGGLSSTLTIDVYQDGRKAQTLTIPTTERRVRRRLTGSGYDIAFAVTGTDAEDAKILEHIVQFESAGEGPH